MMLLWLLEEVFCFGFQAVWKNVVFLWKCSNILLGELLFNKLYKLLYYFVSFTDFSVMIDNILSKERFFPCQKDVILTGFLIQLI